MVKISFLFPVVCLARCSGIVLFLCNDMSGKKAVEESQKRKHYVCSDSFKIFSVAAESLAWAQPYVLFNVSG